MCKFFHFAKDCVNLLLLQLVLAGLNSKLALNYFQLAFKLSFLSVLLLLLSVKKFFLIFKLILEINNNTILGNYFLFEYSVLILEYPKILNVRGHAGEATNQTKDCGLLPLDGHDGRC